LKQCKICHSTTNIEIDHIIPVSKGGTKDISNLQVLCKECHTEKSTEEYSEYVDYNPITSCLNIPAVNILYQSISTKIAHSHILNERDHSLPIYSIDINGCRRNIMTYSKYNYPKYSVLDH
jgi:hypothetical protein